MHISSAVAEQTFEQFWAHKQAGHFDHSIELLTSLGYPAETVATALDPNSYYFPNLVNGSIEESPTSNDDRIPVIAAESGLQLTARTQVMHRLQRRVLKNAGVTYANLQPADGTTLGSQDNITIIDMPEETAYVRYRLFESGGNYYRGLPTLVVSLGNTAVVPQVDMSSVVMHELTHITQALSAPAYIEEGRLQLEIEAYAVQAAGISDPRTPYTLSTVAAAEFDALRKKWLGNDVYTPTGEFVAQLKNEPMFKRIVDSVS
jgi:hypothetical protein